MKLLQRLNYHLLITHADGEFSASQFHVFGSEGCDVVSVHDKGTVNAQELAAGQLSFKCAHGLFGNHFLMVCVDLNVIFNALNIEDVFETEPDVLLVGVYIKVVLLIS